MICSHWDKIEPKYFPIQHLKTSLPGQKRMSEGKPLLVRSCLPCKKKKKKKPGGEKIP